MYCIYTYKFRYYIIAAENIEYDGLKVKVGFLSRGTRVIVPVDLGVRLRNILSVFNSR